MPKLTYPGINHFFELAGAPLEYRQSAPYCLELKRIDQTLGAAAEAQAPAARDALIAEAKKQRAILQSLLKAADAALDYVEAQAAPVPGVPPAA